MAEDGPEAIMPLGRSATGSLGVRMLGGSSNSNSELVSVLRQVLTKLDTLTNVTTAAGKQLVDTVKQGNGYQSQIARSAALASSDPVRRVA